MRRKAALAVLLFALFWVVGSDFVELAFCSGADECGGCRNSGLPDENGNEQGCDHCWGCINIHGHLQFLTVESFHSSNRLDGEAALHPPIPQIAPPDGEAIFHPPVIHSC